MKIIEEIVHGVRSLRASYSLRPSAKADVYIVVGEGSPEKSIEAITEGIDPLTVLSSAHNVKCCSEDEVPPTCGVSVVLTNIKIFVDLKGLIDVDVELKKINKKLGIVEKSLDSLKKKMSIPNYETKVPEQVRVANAEKFSRVETEYKTLLNSKEDFEKMK
ncbi:hypothetical protein GEMRC1_011646 [Eukaryota sp. GEM-RC1]